MYVHLRNLVLSKKYLFRNQNILNCFSRYANTINTDPDLINFYSCLLNHSLSISLSEYRYLSDILMHLSIGSLGNVSLSGGKQTLAEIIGFNTTLTTTDKTSLISAINEIKTTAYNAFNIAGNGLTSSGTTVNVGAGDGITVNANDVAVRITATTNKGGLEIDTTDQGLGVKLAATSGLTISDGSLAVGAGNGITVNTNTVQAKIDGTTVIFSESNALQTPILVRKADDSDDATIDIIVGGNTPTGNGNGLAKLNQDITVRHSVVAVSNALFTQKVPTLLFQCQDSNTQTRTFLRDILKAPYNVEDNSISNGNKCLELALKVASGTPDLHTVNAISKTDCQSLVTNTVNSLSNSNFKKAMQDNVYIAGAIKAEVCAQFFDT